MAWCMTATIALAHVEQPGVIDAVAINAQKTEVLLALVQHLPWNERTKALIERKVPTYVASVESGDLKRRYPQADGLAVVIEIAYFEEPDSAALLYLAQLEEQLKSKGVLLQKRKLEWRK